MNWETFWSVLIPGAIAYTVLLAGFFLLLLPYLHDYGGLRYAWRTMVRCYALFTVPWVAIAVCAGFGLLGWVGL